jgi:hypothetical protein
MGLRSYSNCRRVGINDSSTEAFWRANGAYALGNEVVCCK